MAHVPVLLDSVLDYLDVRPGQNYVDATFGGGGYTEAILKLNAPSGRVLALDWDEEALGRASRKLGGCAEARSNQTPEPRRGGSRPSTPANGLGRLTAGRLILAAGNFRDIEAIVLSESFKDVAGVVFDLGLSSDLIERSGRGFSYLRDEPLVMTYSRPGVEAARTARTVVNSYPVGELENVFRKYGQERQARRIAGAIAEQRKKKRIETTGELVSAIEMITGSTKTKARIFQALRIEVNRELENLEVGLAGAWRIMAKGGRLVVVSYHSLEDGIVKEFFKSKHRTGQGEILTKKPAKPGAEEIKQNRRARSAKLRAIARR